VYAATQAPPWQFFEQHSVDEAQVFPRVVQVATVVVTVWHLPAVHVPEQQSRFDVQLPALLTHALLSQVPDAEQDRLQHSALDPQAWPLVLQNAEVVQVPFAQVVEQQSPFAVQALPPVLQAGAAHRPPLHAPEQQSAFWVQVWLSFTHWAAGSTHTFEAQAPEQQSAPVAQAAFRSRQVAQWPVVSQPPEQQVAPLMQVLPVVPHVGGGGAPQVVLHTFEQHSAAVPQAVPSATQGRPQVPSVLQKAAQHSPAVVQLVPSALHGVVQTPFVQVSPWVQHGTDAEQAWPVGAQVEAAWHVPAVQVSPCVQHGIDAEQAWPVGAQVEAA